jgi:hypothetical protein
VYKAEAENKAMGQAFGKKFDKAAKAKVMDLSSDAIRTYIKDGKIDVNGLQIVTGMLTISKVFNQDYQNSKDWACASSMKSSVMLDIVQTDELKHIGVAREVTNRIQRLRKTSGISIDDQIEIFFSFDDENKDLSKIVEKYTTRVSAQTRMPFLPIAEKQGDQKFVGETEFANPDDELDQVRLKIFFAAPKVTSKIELDFESQGKTVVEDLKNHIMQHDRRELQNLVHDNKGVIDLDINGVKVQLHHRVHFYIDGRDKFNSTQM